MNKFCKKLFLKISQYSRKKPVLETLFNLEYCEIFQSTYFEEHLQTAGSENVHETEKSQKLLVRDFNST